MTPLSIPKQKPWMINSFLIIFSLVLFSCLSDEKSDPPIYVPPIYLAAPGVYQLTDGTSGAILGYVKISESGNVELRLLNASGEVIADGSGKWTSDSSQITITNTNIFYYENIDAPGTVSSSTNIADWNNVINQTTGQLDYSIDTATTSDFIFSYKSGTTDVKINGLLLGPSTNSFPDTSKINEYYVITQSPNYSCTYYQYTDTNNTLKYTNDNPADIDTARYHLNFVCNTAVNSSCSKVTGGDTIIPSLRWYKNTNGKYYSNQPAVSPENIPNLKVLDTLSETCFINNDTINSINPEPLMAHITNNTPSIKNKDPITNQFKVLSAKDTLSINTEVTWAGNPGRCLYFALEGNPTFIKLSQTFSETLCPANPSVTPKIISELGDTTIDSSVNYSWKIKLMDHTTILDSVTINSKLAATIKLDNTDSITVDTIAPTFMVVTNREKYCADSILIDTLSTDTINYEIVGGKLHTWESTHCYKTIYDGGHPSVIGIWTTTFDTLPTGIANCSDSNTIYEGLPFITQPMGTLEITANGAFFQIEGDVCMGEAMQDIFTRDTGNVDTSDNPWPDSLGEPGLTKIEAQNCSELSFMMFEGGLDLQGSMIFENIGNDKMTSTMSIDTCSTTDTTPLFGSDPESCTEEPNPFEEGAFQQCFLGVIFSNLCPADFMVSIGDTSSAIQRINCNSVKIILPNVVEELTYTLSYKDLGFDIEVVAGQCSATGRMDFGNDSNAVDPFADTTFTNCLTFREPGAKRAVSPDPLVNPLSLEGIDLNDLWRKE